MPRALIALAALLAALAATPAQAGPARYDKENRSFRFTYTFVDLPSSGFLTTSGATLRKPTDAQQQSVRELVGAVSDVMFQATEGRARIGSLDYVDTIKDADLVISLTGQPASAGFSARPGFGTVGQIALYYQTLVPEIRQDVINTAVHEVFHYLFGLADEYNFPGGCPSPGGRPGCIMDNYLTGARGYMGRLCQPGEHNAQPDQIRSCQEIVDEFFRLQGVEKSAVTDPTSQPFTPDPRVTVVQSALGEVRNKVVREKRLNASGLASFARTTLEKLIAEFNQNARVPLTMDRKGIADAVRLIVKAGSLVPIEPTAGLGPAALELLVQKARQLGEKFLQDAAKRRPDDRYRAIRGELRRYVGELVRDGKIDADAFGSGPQAVLVERLARQEARDPEILQVDRLAQTGAASLELDRRMAEWIVQILDEQGAPGTRSNLAFLRGFDERNRALLVPGRNADELFGRRRSRFITPSARAEWARTVLTQGGVFPYDELRDRGFGDFARLIDRERIVLDTPDFAAVGGRSARPRGPRIERPLAAPADAAEQGERNNVIVTEFLNTIFDEIERNRLENVAILVPPDGLPSSVQDTLRIFGGKLNGSYDLRLDLVLVGSAPVSAELRHLAMRSHGSVLTIADVDEIGAIAQRLRNEQSDGAWIVIPQQGTFPSLVQRPEASDLATLRAWGENDLKTVQTALDALEPKLLALYDQRVTDDVKRRLDTAVNLERSLDDILGRLDAVLRSPELGRGDQANKDRRNLAYMQLIAEAHAILDRSVSGMRSILDTPAADDVSSDLRGLVEALLKDEALGPALRLPSGLIRLHEKALEAALKLSGDNLPIYSRTDRTELERLRRNGEAIGIGPGHAVLDNLAPPGGNLIRLARFYTGGEAVECVIGLSRPLPAYLRPGSNRLEAQDCSRSLRLYSDQGSLVDDGTLLRFDEARSSDTLLVYTAQGPDRSLPPGWYTPVFVLEKETLGQLNGPARPDAQGQARPGLQRDELNFTFSVASDRPNTRLIARLVEPADDPDEGTVHRLEGHAIVEVEVLSRSPVRGAKVVGFYQKIAPGDAASEILPQEVIFYDNGPASPVLRPAQGRRPEVRDRIADDGIYTGAIPLAAFNDAGAEIRVFIQAESNAGSRYRELESLSLIEPPPAAVSTVETAVTPPPASTLSGRREATKAAVAEADRLRDAQRHRDTEAAEGPVPHFQRATSLHFRVDP